MEDDVVYQGCRIRPGTWSLDEGRFGAKVVVHRNDQEAPGAAHLLVLTGSWGTREDAQREAIGAGMRFVDTLLTHPPGTSST